MNMYYSPETHGARIIGCVDTIGGYEFNMLAVFERVSDGALFWETDSGCSCVSPFDAANWENMRWVTSGAQFASDARKWLRDSYGASADDRDAIERLIIKTRQTFKRNR